MAQMNFSSHLPPDARILIEANTHYRHYKKGSTIYSPGEMPIGIYFVKEGLVGLISISNKGSQHLLRLFAANNFFGHRALFAEEPYHGQTICLEPSEIGLVPLRIIEEILKQFPEVARLIISTLARELGLAEAIRQKIADDEVIQRIASSLVYLKEIHADHKWTRNEIANYCASTGPTVIRGLSALEEMGLIEQSGREIKILNRSQLIQIAQGEIRPRA